MRVHLTLLLFCSLPFTSFAAKKETAKPKTETNVECTAARPIPVLNEKHYKDYVRKLSQSKERPNDATEEVSLSKDLALTVSTTGCMDSVARIFDFKINRKLTPEEEKRDDKAWVKWTGEQLNSLSLSPEFKESFKHFMKNLHDFTQELDKGKIPIKNGSASVCMFGQKNKDGDCVFENGGEYLFSLKKEKDKVVVSVGSYDYL